MKVSNPKKEEEEKKKKEESFRDLDSFTLKRLLDEDENAKNRGWMEIALVNGLESSSISLLGDRIQQGLSIVLIFNNNDNIGGGGKDGDDNTNSKNTNTTRIVSEENNERIQLIEDCIEFASTTTPTDFETDGRRRLPTQRAIEALQYLNYKNGTFDTPCGEPLPDPIDQVVETILHRVAQFIDEKLTMIVPVLFPHPPAPVLSQQQQQHNDNDNSCNSLVSAFLEDKLQFASREPAVNIYRDGGEFASHQDGEALTVLLTLSSYPEDYTGGGTAFWSKQDATSRKGGRSRTTSTSTSATVDSANNYSDDDGSGGVVELSDCGSEMPPPTLVLKPPAGTVILFGGTVTHAGRPVESGTRVVMVASFSLRKDDDEEES